MGNWMTKALAVTPQIITSMILWMMVLVLQPPPVMAALMLAGMVITLVLLTGAGESLAAWVLTLSRPARAWELEVLAPALTVLSRAGLGPPLYRIRVRRSRIPGTLAFGRRTVVVSTALVNALADRRIPHDQGAALIGHAAALVRSGRMRNDPAIVFLTLPWQFLHLVVALISGTGRGLPLASVAWRGRFVIVTVAVVQNIHEGLPWVAALIGAIGALSYLIPYWARRWERSCTEAADQALIDAGLANAWVAYLSPLPRTTHLRRRLLRLQPPTAAPIGLIATSRVGTAQPGR